MTDEKVQPSSQVYLPPVDCQSIATATISARMRLAVLSVPSVHMLSHLLRFEQSTARSKHPLYQVLGMSTVCGWASTGIGLFYGILQAIAPRAEL
ncbi:hypothetical protein NG895_10820 [Aeoliella sp. ICT_H6.2]|uniref:Uncharacterized protein n=1 Tax=Aeoliella straminimaris TaxID=2954799 RepID=A0A9X2JH95_9BACT|nr:hypothetical protein [Aeoliella straminimaris]MCO6044398.1 hypothetical protein [Aeoliella straminimaris]